MLQSFEAYAWVSKWLTLHLKPEILMCLILSKRGPLDNVQDIIACLFIINYLAKSSVRVYGCKSAH